MISLKKAIFTMVDLHGLSESDAEDVVNYWLSVAKTKNIYMIRFVTGRGNHVNAKGERGTLFKKFPTWIERSALKDQVEKCSLHDGFFEVSFYKKETANTDFFKTNKDIIPAHHLETIKAKANQGFPYFQFYYGKLLESAESSEHNFKEAVEWYFKAAEKDYVIAIQELSRCYFHGVGVLRDEAKAVEWLKKADALGCVEAAVSLGDSYSSGKGVLSDARTAVSYYAKAAAKGNVESMRKLANAYQQGEGVNIKDNQKSFFWFKKAADLGDMASSFNVAVMYQNGLGVEKNLKEGQRYLIQAAEGGDVDAQCWLGSCYYNGNNGIPLNKSLGIVWLEKAVKNGSISAMHELSLVDDEKISAEYLEKSAAVGHPIDKIRLYSKKGELEKMTEQQKLELIKKEIKKYCQMPVEDINMLDHETRFFVIDWLLQYGKKNKPKALLVLNHHAESNCIFSLRRLIMLNSRGDMDLKIKKNLSLAMSNMEKACQFGDSKTMVQLASMYEQGDGVVQSIEKALALYKQATELLNPTAFYKLAVLFYEGKLVQKNLHQAQVLCAHAIEAERIIFEVEKGIMLKILFSGMLDTYSKIQSQACELLVRIEEEMKAANQSQLKF